MAEDAADWRVALSATDRFATIQALQASLPENSMSQAMTIEQAAYTDSSSLSAYHEACKPPSAATSPPHTLPDISSGQGITIGSYTNCVFIADGVTASVYRTPCNMALKVITAPTTAEPHNPQREIKILQSLQHKNIIPLLDSFRDQEKQLVLSFPYMPYTLSSLLERGTPSLGNTRTIFRDILDGLVYLHEQGIIHRDFKPSAVLLASESGPAYLSDFGTAWHPEMSVRTEPVNDKILDIGTGAYRAPDTLFVDKSYGPAVDMWAFGVMLAEAITNPPKPPFESRAAHEDGNQLGLILSIFKTLGTPTPETWPEASTFKVSPFEMWTVFPPRTWPEILPSVDPEFLEVVHDTVRYGGRATASKVRSLSCFRSDAP